MAGVELIILAVIYGVVTAIWNSCVIVVRQSEGAPPVSLLWSSPLPLRCTRGHARQGSRRAPCIVMVCACVRAREYVAYMRVVWVPGQPRCLEVGGGC